MLSEMKSDYPTLDMVSLKWTSSFIFLAGTLAGIFALFKPVITSNDEKDSDRTPK